jgi:hypothetical protein
LPLYAARSGGFWIRRCSARHCSVTKASCLWRRSSSAKTLRTTPIITRKMPAHRDEAPTCHNGIESGAACVRMRSFPFFKMWTSSPQGPRRPDVADQLMPLRVERPQRPGTAQTWRPRLRGLKTMSIAMVSHALVLGLVGATCRNRSHHRLPDVVNHAAEISASDIAGNDNTTLDVLALRRSRCTSREHRLQSPPSRPPTPKRHAQTASRITPIPCDPDSGRTDFSTPYPFAEAHSPSWPSQARASCVT